MTHIDAEDAEDDEDNIEYTILSYAELETLNKDFIKHPDYTQQDYEEMPTASCEVCEETYNYGGHGCKHYYACEDCRYNSGPQHYGHCIYCILDGIIWNIEWDNWDDIVSKGTDITLTGMRDVFKYGKGYMYNNSAADSKTLTFRTLYGNAVDIANIIRYDRDDGLIIDEIEASMT